MGVLFLQTILMFPGEFRTMSCIPANFDKLDTTPSCLVHLPISNLYWFFDKVERVVNMNFVSRNDYRLLSRTLLQI
ncbi:hypothetical protein Hanom_Chr08g00746201 [Helianthus anomalus]